MKLNLLGKALRAWGSVSWKGLIILFNFWFVIKKGKKKLGFALWNDFKNLLTLCPNSLKSVWENMIENPKIYNIYDFQQPIHGADKHEPGINDIVDHILQQKMANL